jgi:hypothetical protein
MTTTINWKIDHTHGLIKRLRNAQGPNPPATSKKILQGIVTALRGLSLFLKWVSIGGMAIIAALTLLILFAKSNIFILELPDLFYQVVISPIFMAMTGCAYASSWWLVPLFDWVHRKIDCHTIKKELPANFPVDISQTAEQMEKSRDDIAATMDKAKYSLGGIRHFHFESPRNMHSRFQLHLIEVLEDTKIVGYIGCGTGQDLYMYINFEAFSSGKFSTASSWKSFSSGSALLDILESD